MKRAKNVVALWYTSMADLEGFWLAPATPIVKIPKQSEKSWEFLVQSVPRVKSLNENQKKAAFFMAVTSTQHVIF